MSLAVAGALLDGRPVGLRCDGATIEQVGPEVVPQPGDDVIDGAGLLLAPGLLNGHTHAAMTLFRGRGGDLPLMRWLRERVWPAEARLEPQDVYWGTRLACLEMIRTGTVGFWDMYWHPEEAARAVVDAGLRATISAPLIDVGGPGGPGQARERALESLDRLAEAGRGIRPAIAPHAIYTVREETLRWAGERAAERELPLQIHLAETAAEVEDCRREHGLAPAAYLDSCGALGETTVLAHGVWLDRDELELVAARDATLVTNPVANMKLAVGAAFPWPAARAAGVAVGLGTDGPGSNDALDLFAEMKAFALVQKHAAGDAAAATATEAWELATGARAPLLGAAALAAGEPADFLLLDGGDPALAVGDPREGLVYAASGSVVDTTVIAGRPLMRGGRIEGAEEVVARAAERARRLGGFVAGESG